MGIDPRVIVKDGETMKIIKTTEDDDYNVWLQGGRDAHHKKVESIQQIMRSTVTRTNKWRHTKAANDSYIEEGNIKGGPNETDF